MGKALIITEKPSVARDFARVLKVSGRQEGYIENDSYVISWCVGHLVGMVYPESYDEKYKKWRLEDLPFLPKEYKYDVIEPVKNQYETVHKLLFREDIDVVYWAGDAGKEGQTIEENIRNFGGVRPGMKELRVWIDSQTDEELLRGIREARDMEEYRNLGFSGIMRTIEDYAMGINFSRAMSVKYGNLLNRAAQTQSYTAIAVGRVMTCVLGMVVIREREIRNFVETPFYRVAGIFTDANIEGEWKAVEGSEYVASPLLYKENGFRKKEDAAVLIEKLNKEQAVVQEIEKGTSRKRAPLLFNLAELQAECAKRFKISPDQTLNVVQTLYEKKLTTYPRTDARVLSSAIAKEISRNVSRLAGYEPVASFVKEIMDKHACAGIGKSPYTDDSKITDHYAIIPTGQLSELSSLSDLEKKIFDLIVRRFLAIFYPPAQYETVKLVIKMGRESLFASAKVLKEPGYLTVMGKAPGKDKEEGRSEDDEQPVNQEGLLKIAQNIKKGDVLPVQEFQIKEGKTSPPKRYTSGSMVLAMENAGQLIEEEELREQIKGSGIGTSATRAEIIDKLVRIAYLNLNTKTQVLTPSRLGEMVYEVVNLTVPALLNPKMTASWEKGLDGITAGTVEFSGYRAKMEDFIRKETRAIIDRDLKEEISDRISEFAVIGKDGSSPVKAKIGVECPVCHNQLVTTPFGYGCETYKKDGGGCNFSIGAIAGRALSIEEVKSLIENGKTGLLKGFSSKNGKKFDAVLKLVKDPEEQIKINFDFEDKEAYYIKDLVCPVCQSPMVKTAFGFGCSKYDANDPESCRFSIGNICGKTLTLDQAKQLVQNGHTETIRGFKSKNGKKFDACLSLKQAEDGTYSIEFDFDHVEVKKVNGVVCPKCGGEILVTNFGYGCANYKKDKEGSCNFAVGKIAGAKLKEAQLKKLLTEGKTDVISGFKSKNGKKFDAKLAFEEGEIKFCFPDAVPDVESKVNCPVCGYKLIRSKFYLECACGFKISHMVAQVDLTDEVMEELLTKGSTENKITGFHSKTGNLFDAKLKYDKEKGISFDFS
ncbi:MAG: DNA topoisomerase [Lachnospiraceae bacterium]